MKLFFIVYTASGLVGAVNNYGSSRF